MIEKLRDKIFVLMMTSFSIIVLGIIIVFAIFNCTNTIKTSRRMMDRFVIMKDKEFIKEQRNPAEMDSIIAAENEKIKSHIIIVIAVSTIASGMSLIIIYLISKKVSELIVKPVEETLEKQKQFISDASHELKTPLAVIEANSDVLENEIGENKWLKYIQNETKSMDKLINELLLLAKTENIEEIKSYEQINISKETEISIAMFESMAYEKQVKINSRIQPNIFLNCDRQDIGHILSTLIDNAIKHSKTEKTIEIELIKEKNNIILQVKNEGEPIPEEQREKIFERFYRIDKSRNRNEKRYGLGLAIAKASTEKYDGKIGVECENNTINFKVIIPN